MTVAGSNNVTSGDMSISSADLPALVIGLSMNTNGGSGDMGGTGFGGPAAGTGFTEVAQFWEWGVNLATLETATVTEAGGVAAVFDAPGKGSYVTVAAAFY